MKSLLLGILVSSTAFAQFGKPQMISRYGGFDHYNADFGINCYSSDPVSDESGIYLSCLQNTEHVLVRFSPDFEVIARSEYNLFSVPKIVDSEVHWYEFSEAGISQVYEYQNGKLSLTKLPNIAPRFARVDSFTKVSDGRYVYRIEDETRYLNFWENGEIGPFYEKSISHIFPLVTSSQGELIFKVRHKNLQESAPDELIYWNGKFQTLLSDRDMDLNNSIKSFRHQYAVDQGQVALVIQDDVGEALAIVDSDGVKVIARAGVELKSFEFFSPKIRNGVVAFRGVDLQGRKALYVYKNQKLSQVLTQGDHILSDKGFAQINYKVADSIFFSSPAIGEDGSLYQQVTLSDLNTPMTLLGISLVKLPIE